MGINRVRSIPGQEISTCKGPGDGKTEKWPVWLKQGRGIGRKGIGKVTRAIMVLFRFWAVFLRALGNHRWVLSRRDDMVRTLKRATPVR